MLLNLWRTAFFCACASSAFHVQQPQNARLPSLRSSSQFVPPEPKPLQITRLSQIPDLLTASMALALRLGTGTFVLGWKPLGTVEFGKYPVWGPMLAENEYSLKLGPLRYRDGDENSAIARPAPAKPLVLYEYESSPYCRKVREAACLLDIPIEMRPCPGARAGFSDQLFDLTNSRMVPYMSDPNTGSAMFESDAIIDYMFENYGPKGKEQSASSLWTLRGGFALWSSAFAALVRGLPASSRKNSAKPDNELLEKPLVLYAYEQSPFVRKCRETLCELCVPHVVIPCARGSRNRDDLIAKTGRFQVPYLEDPNSGVSLFESNEIIEYLIDEYTV